MEVVKKFVSTNIPVYMYFDAFSTLFYHKNAYDELCSRWVWFLCSYTIKNLKSSVE